MLLFSAVISALLRSYFAEKLLSKVSLTFEKTEVLEICRTFADAFKECRCLTFINILKVCTISSFLCRQRYCSAQVS